MSLVESGGWIESTGRGARDSTLRLRPTGAVVFATLEVPRPVVVRTVGTWPAATRVTRRGHGAGFASAASRCVSWLLGR